MTQRIPVNIVTGFLGVGKTTALTHLLANKPAGEYWAVVVNEFGEVGIDGATLSAAGDDLAVAEVPGGCICCTTSPMLRVSLGKLIRQRRPDRILIEPSGLGHPAGIVDLLRDAMLAKTLTLHAMVTLLDARHLDDERYLDHETWRAQIELADVLVINKTDAATMSQLESAHQLARGLFPPKAAVVEARFGAFDASLLDVVTDTAQPLPPRPASHMRPRSSTVAEPQPLRFGERYVQSSLDAHSCGWVFAADTLFVSFKLAQLFEALTAPELGLTGLTRAKGVFQTERDWYRLDWVDGSIGAAPSAYRRDSRFEVIVHSADAPDWDALEARLFDTRMVAGG
ncbi:CobW family GTP-binding protein [Chitinibacteraceae bacterium HSL-7]